MRRYATHPCVRARARAGHRAARAHHAVHHSGAPTIAHFLRAPDAPLRPLGQLVSHIRDALLPVVPWLAVAALAALVTTRLAASWRDRRLTVGGRVIEIGVPPDVDERAAIVLWSALHDLLRAPWRRLLGGQPHISWEIAASESGTNFRVWVPRTIPPGLLERAIASAWPGASAIDASDDLEEAVPAGSVRATTELTLCSPEWFALSSGMDPDPLPLILGQLAGLTGGTRALVQVIARPATGREQHRLRAAARRIRRGEPASLIARIPRALSTQPAAPPRLDPTVSPDVREVMQKSAEQLYRCLIRVTVTAATRREARGRIHAILGSFAPYNGARVWLRRRRVTRARMRVCTRRLGRRAFLLGVSELAAIAHLPYAQGIAGLARAAARRVAPPPALPRAGRPLGASDAGPARPLAVSVADARQHLHVLGATGAGKSTAIAQLVLADVAAGRGAVVIDPKGDLVDWILARIGRVPDPLVVLDPERSERPVGLNVLQGPDPQLAAEHLVGTFRRMYEQFWGPRHRRHPARLRAHARARRSPHARGDPDLPGQRRVAGAAHRRPLQGGPGARRVLALV
jgi:hypothetical protein